MSVREQAAIIVERLRRQGTSTFRALIADCDSTLLVVGRFLALLELYRESAVSFEQITPLGDLTIRWMAGAEGEVVVMDEFDDYFSDADAGVDSEPDDGERAQESDVE